MKKSVKITESEPKTVTEAQILPEPQTTRDKLIIIAGEMFAENGFDGTSVRDISKKAGVNIAAVNYHFGSKETLYFESVKYVITKLKIIKFDSSSDFSVKKPSLQDFSNRLAAVIFNDVSTFLSDKYPSWFIKLANQCMMTKTPALEAVYNEIMKPDYDEFTQIFREAIPSLNDLSVSFWVHAIVGQITFYTNYRELLFLKLQENHYPETYINALSEHIINMITKGLDLPKPDKSFLDKKDASRK